MKPQLVAIDGGKHEADLAHKEYLRKQQHDWYVRNAEKKKAYGRAYYAAHRQEKIAWALEYRTRKPGVTRKSHLKCQYGLTIEAFEALLRGQDGKCAICRVPLDSSSKKVTPHVDHDHKTGKVRGVLCLLCNMTLGRVERPGVLDLMLRYLGVA